MPRTKQTARRSTPEEERLQYERMREIRKRNRKREAEQKKRYHIEVSFDEEKIRAYFAPTASEGTFRRNMEEGIADSINDTLSTELWKFNGDRRVLTKRLKQALGGRLYSRNIIKDWCAEGLATMKTSE